jgi:hypothetical protein
MKITKMPELILENNCVGANFDNLLVIDNIQSLLYDVNAEIICQNKSFCYRVEGEEDITLVEKTLLDYLGKRGFTFILNNSCEVDIIEVSNLIKTGKTQRDKAYIDIAID